MKGLSVNITKTQVMVISKDDSQKMACITIEGKVLKQVNRFSYMISIITQNGRCDEPIMTRIIIAKGALNEVKKLVTNTSISVGLREIFIRAYARSTFLHRSEAWNTYKQSDGKTHQGFEMGLYRRMLKIPWVDHVSNEQVLQREGVKREIIYYIL